MYDETQMKLLNAAMLLIMEKGYTATTTKDIAKRRGVNECTIFRKLLKGKKGKKYAKGQGWRGFPQIHWRRKP